MKQLLISVLALLGIASHTTAQTNALTVEDITLPQNSEATLTVSFQFDADNTYTGYSFNLELPSDIEFTKVEAEGTDIACNKGTCHDASHSVTANLSEGLVKVAGLSLSSKPLSGTSGVLLTFTIKPVGTLTVGKTFQGSIKDILIVPVSGTKKSLDADQFTVTIGEPVDLRTVLDENATVAPVAASGVDIRVKRTINAGSWSTICLPFAMTESQVKSTFGDDVKLGDFAGYEAKSDEKGNIVGINVKFNTANAMEANHPYIIKVGSDISEFTMDNVDINPVENPTVAAVTRTKKQWSEMTGTYVANTTLEKETLFLSDNKFWYSAGETQMKAYRAFFDFYDVLTEVEGAQAHINIMFEGESTGINAISNSTGNNGKYYNLRGQQVENPQKGLYIRNNKKVMIK